VDQFTGENTVRRFSVGQIWRTWDDKLFGTVLETADDGHSGVLFVAGEDGQTLYRGTAAGFQQSGCWRLMVE
jgi:hypothetical protein